MKNYQQGFVLIQILVAILTGIAVVSSTAFVAYEAGQKSLEESSQSITATTTAEVQLATTSAITEAGTDEVGQDADNHQEERENTTVESNIATSTVQSTTENVAESTGEDQRVDDERDEPERAQTETAENISTPVSVDVLVGAEISTPIGQDFKEQALASITAQMDSYIAVAHWIDNDMMPLFSQRERILDGLISNTRTLITNSSEPIIIYIYNLFIDAYNLDKNQVVNSYRNIFSGIRDSMYDEKISVLKAEYTKFSAGSSVSRAEYDALLQALKQYENSMQSVYNNKIRAITIQYISQISFKDETYQRLWAEIPTIISDPANSAQNLENILNQLRFVQPEPLD